MWAFALAIVAFILGVVSLASGFFVGAVMFLVAIVFLVLGLRAAKQNDPSLGTVETAQHPEPTGRPRMSRGGAGTANERQGQV